jgi:hypothetical protein
MDLARMMDGHVLGDLKEISCAYDYQWAPETSPLRCPCLVTALLLPQGDLDPEAPLKDGTVGHERYRHVSRWAPLPAKWVLDFDPAWLSYQVKLTTKSATPQITELDVHTPSLRAVPSLALSIVSPIFLTSVSCGVETKDFSAPALGSTKFWCEGWSCGEDNALVGGGGRPPNDLVVSGTLAPSACDPSLSDPWRGCEEPVRLITCPGRLEGIGEAVTLANDSDEAV